MSESSSNSQSSVKVQDQRDDPEQDAHEWLLEHYATEPPANVSIRPSPAPEDPPDSPNTTASATPSSAKREEVHDADVLPPEPSSKSKQPKVPSRTPTPLALLEEELDRATPGEGGLPSIAVSPGSDADLALELDLAAGASEHPAAPGTDTSTNNDLDDELLSLLDDKPRHSHSHSYPHSSKASHAASGSTNADKTSVVKDISIKKTSATPAPRLAPTTCAPSERVVMPPPVAPPNQATKSTAGDQQSAARQDKSEALSASSNMKKKEASAKAQKSKQPVKPKPKATTAKLSKAKTAKDDTLGCSGRLTPSGSGTAAKGKRAGVSASAGAAAAAKRSVSAAVGQSRSRSASVMPALPDPHNSKQQAEEEEEEEEEAIDDKLYCICKTSYDEDRVMIACDRCDEWYHTQCLNMNDLEVDLIDQFVCPPCIKANPHLPLKTTYKQRCYAGLKHPRPSSAAACHKPARGAFSKYCSDECGIAYMQRRIDGWGGDQEVLWASVREVKQREGVVVKVHVIEEEPGGAPGSEQKPAGAGGLSQLVMETHEVQKPTKTQYERTVTRLQAELYKIAPKREVLKRELEIILWRRKLLELAAERAERLGECGWDQRLCLDDDEYAEYAAGILESYDEGNGQANGEQSAMQVDGSGVEDGAWWCRGKKKCQRHAGWQKLRASEFEFDQELKEKAMSALTTQEREIRKQLEDAISLHNQKTAINMQSSPLRPLNGHAQANGAVKAKPNGTGKKGKQKR
ncbi:hypothetical protein BD414DRAFT_410362 [Trametes punicea]|nr:hypothetical protein BD414DRAFT_410362 [Trametes punicea]